MKLPITFVIGIAAVLMLLVVVIVFFTSSGGSAAARTEMQRTFTQNCLAICTRSDRASINLATTFPEWQSTCEQLYSVPTGASAQCLDRCECGRIAAPCEFLCSFKELVADWTSFCNRIKTNGATSSTYGQCTCQC